MPILWATGPAHTPQPIKGTTTPGRSCYQQSPKFAVQCRCFWVILSRAMWLKLNMTHVPRRTHPTCVAVCRCCFPGAHFVTRLTKCFWSMRKCPVIFLTNYSTLCQVLVGSEISDWSCGAAIQSGTKWPSSWLNVTNSRYFSHTMVRWKDGSHALYLQACTPSTWTARPLGRA